MFSFMIVALGVVMAALTEPKRAGECIIEEGRSNRSREAITVVSGAGAAGLLGANAVVGKILFGAVSETHVGNTGTGAMSGLAKLGTNCVVGVWTVKCIRAISNNGEFEVTDPNGMTRGTVFVGATFANGITFSIADSTDFIVGDTFLVTVAAGSGKWDEVDPDSITGLQYAKGVLLDAVDASAADADGVVLMRDCIVNKSMLDWGSTSPDTNEKAAFVEQLKALGIIVREAI